MKVVIPTIKHSGSNLVLNAFLADGFEHEMVKGPRLDAKNTVVMDHVLYTKTRKLMDLAEDADVVIVPLRHPNLMALSWAKQGEDLDPDFFQMLRDIEQFMNLPNAVVLPLGGDTTITVDAIFDLTGVRVNLSMPVKSVAGTYALEPDTSQLFQHVHGRDLDNLKNNPPLHILAYYEEAPSGSEEEVTPEEEAKEKAPAASAKGTGKKKSAAAKKKVVAGDEQGSGGAVAK